MSISDQLNMEAEQADKYTTMEKAAKKWLEETDTMQFSEMELLSMFAESQLKEAKATKHTPMQKCPKCDGQGIVSKPPWISGDQQTWDSTSVNHQCDVCNGQKIIPMSDLNELK